MYYKNLPAECIKWIQPLDLNTILTEANFKEKHDWTHLNIDDVLTLEGKSWFLERNIPLERRCTLFQIQANHEGTIHTDHPIADAAFNFVLKGTGEMQWIKIDADAYTEYKSVKGIELNYQVYKNIRGISALALWTGHAGLVKTNVPHRIVTMNSSRICLSLRTPKTFNELSKLF